MVRQFLAAFLFLLTVFSAGMIATVGKCSVSSAFAMDTAHMRRSVNVVDVRVRMDNGTAYVLNMYDGDGNVQPIAIVCDGAERECEVATAAGVPPTPVYIPTVEKSTATATATASPTPPPTNTPPPPTVAPTTAPSGLTRINTATDEELDKLPHVGPVILGRIKDARPLTSCDDADKRIKGWGATMVADTCPLIDWTLP